MNDDAIRRREQEEGVTVAQVDAAIAKARHLGNLKPDEVAVLWLAKASLLGISCTPMHLVLTMGVSVAEAEDMIARLGEHGLVEGAD